MKRYSIKQLLQRYLKGNVQPVERKQVDDWYKQLDQEEMFDLSGEKEKQTKAEIWQGIQQRMYPAEKVFRKVAYWWYAAACLVPLILGVLWLTYRSHSEPPPQSNHSIVVSTLPGERKKIQLNDGSILTLNGGSTVRISNHFKTNRYVEIVDGETFFQVQRDVNHPFTVKSGPLLTQVLGTSFNIKAFKGLPELEVSVASGEVSVGLANQQGQRLKKGERLRYDVKHDMLRRSAVDEESPSWLEGKVVLDNVAFEEMVLLFQKNYNLSIRSDDPKILEKHFTATLQQRMPAEKALEILLSIHQLEYKKRRDYVEIFR